ncbi:AAA family ATPase [Sinomonas halotolerans]|uniref:P-loop NTPase n=1 Tax=Sinomonas halotolerans TaxID=1644133 RepID=A0ABU9WWG9_9MICC
MSIPVVTIGAGQAELVGSLERLHGPVTVVRRCSELAELIAACQTGLARAAVVAGGTADITATLVDRLATVGVALVGLSDDDAERSRLEGLGVLSAREGVAASELAGMIAEAVERAALTSAPAPLSSFAVPGARPLAEPAQGESSEEPAGEGEIIAFWGPIGSPGRTTLAVNCAAELVAEGRRVVLVDADTYGASVAAMLGLLDDSAGLAQACRLADQGLLDRQSLERIATPVIMGPAAGVGTLRVLTGLTRADRWPEIRAAALGAVLERCREIADSVIVDAGFCLEADEELSFDTMAPRRNAATLRSLEVADRVFAVGAADPVGMPRLVRALGELEQAVPQASPAVVFNKVRPGSVGRFPERALREAWDRFGPAHPITAMIPFDGAAADAALLGGSVLLEAAPESGIRNSIARLVCEPAQHDRRFARRKTKAGVGAER